MRNLSELAISRPYLVKICNMNAGSQAPKEECAMYALNVCSHTFNLYQELEAVIGPELETS